MLSDYKRVVTKQYGVLGEQSFLANRTTFLIDMDGKIAMIDEGNSAVDPFKADEACSRLAHKKQ